MAYIYNLVAAGTVLLEADSPYTIPFQGVLFANNDEQVEVAVSAHSGTLPTLEIQYQTWDSTTNAWVNQATVSGVNTNVTTSIPLISAGQVPSQLILTVGGTSGSFTIGITQVG